MKSNDVGLTRLNKANSVLERYDRMIALDE